MSDEGSAKNTDFVHRHGANIVLFGETGAGKSTLINYLCNYFLQGSFSNLKVAIPSKYHPQTTQDFPHSESNLNDSTQSKTNVCHEYAFVDSITRKRYVFVDTPGISDTRGNEQNNINITRIIDAIIRLGYLTTIIFVVNASLNRFSINFRSMISCLHNYLPDKMLTQVIVLLTNVRKYQSTFDLNMLDLHGEVYPIYMQNGAFVCDPHRWGNPVNQDLQADWDRSMQQIKSMLSIIDSLQPQSVKLLKVLKHERNSLKAILHQFRLEIVHSFKIQVESICSTFNELINRVLPYASMTDDLQLNMLCTICNQVCHANCSWGDTIAILNGQHSSQTQSICAACKYSCSVLNHYQARKTIRIEDKTIGDFVFALKYRLTSSNHHPMNELVDRNEILALFQRMLDRGIEEIRSKAMKINAICSAFPFDQEIQSFNDHLLLELRIRMTNDVQYRLDEIFHKMIGLRDFIKEQQEMSRENRLPMLVVDRNEILATENSIDIIQQKTVDLVELYNRGPTREMIIPILSELHRRVAGKSIYPLTNPEEIFDLNQKFDKYKDKDTRQLSVIYRQFQTQINEILGGNILEIAKIPSHLLRENFAILTLLEKKEREENLRSEPSPRVFCSIHPPFFPPTNEPINVEIPENRSTIEQVPIGFQFMIPSIQRPEQHLNPALPYPTNQWMPRSSIETPSSETSTSQAQLSTSVNDLRSSFYSDTRSTASSIPDVVPPISTNQIGFQRLVNQTDESNDDQFYSMINTRLVRLYEEAKESRQRDKQQKLYEELIRRCFGQYPRLIDENKTYFFERAQCHREKSLDRLREDHRLIIRKIRYYINEDDVTLINEIPTELIIDSAAIHCLIRSAIRQGDFESRTN